MGDEHGTAAAAVSMCLAVVQIGSAVMATLVGGLLLVRLRRPIQQLSPVALAIRVISPVALPRARAGPELLQVFLR